MSALTRPDPTGPAPTDPVPPAGGPALQWDAHTHVDTFLHGRATN